MLITITIQPDELHDYDANQDALDDIESDVRRALRDDEMCDLVSREHAVIEFITCDPKGPSNARPVIALSVASDLHGMGYSDFAARDHHPQDAMHRIAKHLAGVALGALNLYDNPDIG